MDHQALVRKHQSYIDKGCRLVIDDRSQFSVDEIRRLEQYGGWFQALASGQLQPITIAQKQFMEVAHGLRKAETSDELLWVRYQIERARTQRNRNKESSLDGDGELGGNLVKKLRQLENNNFTHYNGWAHGDWSPRP